MVRIATCEDAAQLEALNNEFNGRGETCLDNIKNSLANNKQELVFVYPHKNLLVGFCCVQLKKSFCYDYYMPEFTEVYVKPQYRHQKIATKMMLFAEHYCKTNLNVHTFELLTGAQNKPAQAVYGKLGYGDEGEIHLSKTID